MAPNSKGGTLWTLTHKRSDSHTQTSTFHARTWFYRNSNSQLEIHPMLLNPLQFQEVGTEPSSGSSTSIFSSDGPLFQDVLHSVQQGIEGHPGESAPPHGSHSSTAREVYPSLASLIAEILTGRTPQTSPEPGPSWGGENGVATLEKPFASAVEGDVRPQDGIVPEKAAQNNSENRFAGLTPEPVLRQTPLSGDLLKEPFLPLEGEPSALLPITDAPHLEPPSFGHSNRDETQSEKNGADFTASETAEPSTISVPVAPLDPELPSNAEGSIPLMDQAFENRRSASPQAGSDVGTDRAGAGPPVSPDPVLPKAPKTVFPDRPEHSAISAFEQAVGDEPDHWMPSNWRRASETPPTVQQGGIERPNLQRPSGNRAQDTPPNGEETSGEAPEPQRVSPQPVQASQTPPAVQTPVPEASRPQIAQDDNQPHETPPVVEGTPEPQQAPVADTLQPVQTPEYRQAPVADTPLPVQTPERQQAPVADTPLPVQTPERQQAPIATSQPVQTPEPQRVSPQPVQASQTPPAVQTPVPEAPRPQIAQDDDQPHKTPPVIKGTPEPQQARVATPQPVQTPERQQAPIATSQPVQTPERQQAPVAETPQPADETPEPQRVSPQPVQASQTPPAVQTPVPETPRPQIAQDDSQPHKTPPVIKGTPEPQQARVATPQPVQTPERQQAPIATSQPVQTPERQQARVATPQPVQTPEPQQARVAETPPPVQTPEPQRVSPQPIQASQTPPAVQTPVPETPRPQIAQDDSQPRKTPPVIEGTPEPQRVSPQPIQASQTPPAVQTPVPEAPRPQIAQNDDGAQKTPLVTHRPAAGSPDIQPQPIAQSPDAPPAVQTPVPEAPRPQIAQNDDQPHKTPPETGRTPERLTETPPAVQTPEPPKGSPRLPVENGKPSAPAPAASQTPSAVRTEPFLPDGERILNAPKRSMDTPISAVGNYRGPSIPLEHPEGVEVQVRQSAPEPSPGVQTPPAEDAGGPQAEPNIHQTTENAPSRPEEAREPAPVKTAQPDTALPAASRPAPVTASKPAGIQQAAALPAAETLQETYRVSDQLVRGVRFLSRDGTSQVTIRLDPPELGQVTIRLVSANQTISGEIAVENRQVHEVVQTHLNDLRQALAEQGIQVDQLDVSVDNRGTSGANRDSSQSSSQDRSSKSDPDNNPDQERRSSPRDDRSAGGETPDEGHVDFTA